MITRCSSRISGEGTSNGTMLNRSDSRKGKGEFQVNSQQSRNSPSLIQPKFAFSKWHHPHNHFGVAHTVNSPKRNRCMWNQGGGPSGIIFPSFARKQNINQVTKGASFKEFPSSVFPTHWHPVTRWGFSTWPSQIGCTIPLAIVGALPSSKAFIAAKVADSSWRNRWGIRVGLVRKLLINTALPQKYSPNGYCLNKWDTMTHHLHNMNACCTDLKYTV